ncbi:MAG TPA: hypothetical protein VL307_18680 [Chitinophagaceae bacterium]|nr:hypothetical protein [Chitinophagaceae bacterium]
MADHSAGLSLFHRYDMNSKTNGNRLVQGLIDISIVLCFVYILRLLYQVFVQ